MKKQIRGRTAAQTLYACVNLLRTAHADAAIAARLMGNAGRAVQLVALIEAAEQHAHRLHSFAQADEQTHRAEARRKEVTP